MYKVAAYITAYQDLDALEQCITAINNQSYPIDKKFIIDNSPSPLLSNKQVNNSIIIDSHPENLGISGGLKIGIQWAINNNYDFLWTFDQDSQPSPDLLKQLISCYNLINQTHSRIGIIAPLPVDKTTRQEWHGIIYDNCRFKESPLSEKDTDFYECDAVITSGSLINLIAAKEVPLPEEGFFIDAVDWEYCHKFRQKSYGIILVKKATLDHRFGNSHQINLSWIKRIITIYNYSPLRYYYICRNYTLIETRLAKINHHFIQSIIYRLRFLIIMIAKITLFEKELIFLKVWACLRGTYDGFRGKLGKTW